MGAPRKRLSDGTVLNTSGQHLQKIKTTPEQSRNWYRRSRANGDHINWRIFEEGLPKIIDYRGHPIVFEIINDSGVRRRAIVNPRRTPGQEWILIDGPKPLTLTAAVVGAWRSTRRLLLKK